MMSASEQFCQQINGNSNLSEWKNKIDQKLRNNQYKVGEPTEEIIVTYAMEFIYDYHNAVNIGRLWSGNRLPNEKDIEAFAKIITALLYEWQSISSFDNSYSVQEKIRKQLLDALQDEQTE